MAGQRNALIIASYDYQDPGLRRLRAPAHDAEALTKVLRDPDVGGFDVRTLLNQPAHLLNEAVEDFFADRGLDDLLLLHFSCHGVKDDTGELHFAATNTNLRRLGATAVAADFVSRRMNRSRSRRIVLLLDCCYAGAFDRGMTAKAGATMDIGEQLSGRGRAVITSALVEGLATGEADSDQDGLISLDELYDYVYDKVRETTPKQTPGKWAFGMQGDLHIAKRIGPVSTLLALPVELRQVIDHPLAGVRGGAIEELARLLPGDDASLALGAKLALERLAKDDNHVVSTAALTALDIQPPPAEPTSTVPLTPEPARSQPPAEQRPSSGPETTDRAQWPPTLLMFTAAALLLLGAFLPYHRYTIESNDTIWFLTTDAILAAAVGGGLLIARTRRSIGPGLLLGAGAAMVYVLAALVTNLREPEGLGIGYWFALTAYVTELLAAVLILRRIGPVSFAGWPRGRVSWIVILLGVLNMASVFVPEHGMDRMPTVSVILFSVVAIAVPVIATATAPRKLGASLLIGWIAANAAFVVLQFKSPIVPTAALLALLVTTVFFARTKEHEPTVG